MNYAVLLTPDLQHAIATNNDQQAYAELFNRFAPLLVRFTRTIVRNKQAAEEIVSDVFIRIWEKRKTLDQIRDLKIYLYVSARNYSVNYLRSKEHIMSIQMESLPDELNTFAVDPFELAVTEEIKSGIEQAVNDLPERCRLIFKLIKEDGLKQKEVAELLHLSSKTVENQLAIALKKLAAAVQNIPSLEPLKNSGNF